MKWFVLFILLTGSADAITTTTQLIQKYGKRNVIKFISNKTNDGVTIIFNGQLKKAHMPSVDYVNVMTINRDLNSLGLTPTQVDTIFIKQKQNENKDNIKNNEYWLKKQNRWSELKAKEENTIHQSKSRQKITTTTVRDNISIRCTKKWKTNYRMVKFCVDKQKESLSQLQKSSSSIPYEISKECTKKWKTNYRMVKYCVDKQQKALNDLKKSGIYR